MYDYDDVERMVKIFINEQYNDAKRMPNTARNCRAIAYGALQFATNYLFPCYNNDLAIWWREEMKPKFTELMIKGN